MLVEGSSMRSVSRVLGVGLNTVSRLLVDAGKTCVDFHDETVRGVFARSVQVDEIWSFTFAKRRNADAARGVIDHAGDLWTWTAIDGDTKLLISWLVGDRSGDSARLFMHDLQSRVVNRVQLFSDGHNAYAEAVDEAFGSNVDYGQLIKSFSRPLHDDRRYSPPDGVVVNRIAVYGNPDMDELNTSYVERHNLSMRMAMRRFTRLTNAFSKKALNHMYAMALYSVWYNFMRGHSSLQGATPAVIAGLAEYPLDLRWLVMFMNERAPAPRRGPYGIGMGDERT